MIEILSYRMDSLSEQDKLDLEQNFVQNTYDSIAGDFSNTRYKKWPRVEAFLKSLPPSSLLLDVGCGNGKYLDNSHSYFIGGDISSNLLSICKSNGFEVVQINMMKIPFLPRAFDAIICIAALHHIVTADRRRKCLEDMINLLTGSDSRLLVQVWSFEQELDQNNPYLKKSSFVIEEKPTTLQEDINLDSSTKLPIHKNRTPFKNQDILVPFSTKSRQSELGNSSKEGKNAKFDRHLRYYHVFKEKELESLVEQIPNARIIDSYYDRGNWCAIIGRK